MPDRSEHFAGRLGHGAPVALARLLAALLVALAACAPPRAASAPDIVFVLVDDLGFGDVPWNGSSGRAGTSVPRLAATVAEGARLDAYYTLPVCTPARAALLTGRHPARFGLQGGALRVTHSVGLPAAERTLAEELRAAGYATHVVGKWHLGHRAPFLPREHGFDHHYGSLLASVRVLHHTNRGRLDWWRDGEPARDVGHATDLLGDEALRVLRERDPRRPLFLYLPFTAVHTPLEAPPEDLLRFEHIADPQRRTFAAMLWRLDRAVGEVYDAVRASGRSTIFVFASDNGGAAHIAADNGALREGKGSVHEGGVRVPAFVVFPGVVPAGSVVSDRLHVTDWFPTLLGLAGLGAPSVAVDGADVSGVLAGKSAGGEREILLNASRYGSALLLGDHKLVQDHDGAPLELYDLARDPGETDDLAAREAERTADLAARLAAWRALARPELVGRPEPGAAAAEDGDE